MKKILNMLLPNVQQNCSTGALLVFVLLFFAGSGRFSVDGWLAKSCLKDTKVWVKGDTKHHACPVLDKQKQRLSLQSQLTLSRKFITLTPQMTVTIN